MMLAVQPNLEKLILHPPPKSPQHCEDIASTTIKEYDVAMFFIAWTQDTILSYIVNPN